MQIVKQSFEILGGVNGEEMLQRIEAAGRTCYKSESKATADSAVRFVAMVLERGHESVIEHESMSVRIVCDRGISHEIVRHRLASYSQESTRYCNYSSERFGEELTFIEPGFLWETGGAPCHDEWFRAMEAAERSYLTMMRYGASPQGARSVLPNSLKTEIVMTCNVREWRHFFKMRTADAAHPQMRELARPMLSRFRKLVPVIFDDVGKVG